MSPIYRQPGRTVDAVQYRQFARSRISNATTPQLRGIKIGGRVAIIYSREDLSAGLVGEPVDGITGYSPASATELMTAIILYAKGKSIELKRRWHGPRCRVKCEHDRGKKLNLTSEEDYLASELTSQVKHEYLGGVVYAMAGAEPAQPNCHEGSWDAVWSAKGNAVPAVRFGYKNPGPDAGADANYYPMRRWSASRTMKGIRSRTILLLYSRSSRMRRGGSMKGRRRMRI